MCHTLLQHYIHCRHTNIHFYPCDIDEPQSPRLPTTDQGGGRRQQRYIHPNYATPSAPGEQRAPINHNIPRSIAHSYRRKCPDCVRAEVRSWLLEADRAAHPVPQSLPAPITDELVEGRAVELWLDWAETQAATTDDFRNVEGDGHDLLGDSPDGVGRVRRRPRQERRRYSSRHTTPGPTNRPAQLTRTASQQRREADGHSGVMSPSRESLTFPPVLPALATIPEERFRGMGAWGSHGTYAGLRSRTVEEGERSRRSRSIRRANEDDPFWQTRGREGVSDSWRPSKGVGGDDKAGAAGRVPKIERQLQTAEMDDLYDLPVWQISGEHREAWEAAVENCRVEDAHPYLVSRTPRIVCPCHIARDWNTISSKATHELTAIHKESLAELRDSRNHRSSCLPRQQAREDLSDDTWEILVEFHGCNHRVAVFVEKLTYRNAADVQAQCGCYGFDRCLMASRTAKSVQSCPGCRLLLSRLRWEASTDAPSGGKYSPRFERYARLVVTRKEWLLWPSDAKCAGEIEQPR